ncbi:MAG: hypothetical protein HMLKMBBP_00072 [Planctomycetes bacterium]|nr:hypothetical protein [Planctomycetota bacterium]
MRPRSSSDSWIRLMFFGGTALMIAGVLLVKSNALLGGLLIAVGFVGSVAWNMLPAVRQGELDARADAAPPKAPEPPRG